MSPSTSTLYDAFAMLVLGMGLGGVMQMLVIIVQNGVPHSELGVATSGATFFRSIGGSFGTAIFGAIFSNILVSNLATHLHGLSLPSGFTSSDVTPAALDHLSAAVRAAFVDGYASTIQTVFLVAVPIAALAFLASWLIPQVELKRWSGPVGMVAEGGEAGVAGGAETGEPDAGITEAGLAEGAVSEVTVSAATVSAAAVSAAGAFETGGFDTGVGFEPVVDNPAESASHE
jgi:hypothetical protein